MCFWKYCFCSCEHSHSSPSVGAVALAGLHVTTTSSCSRMIKFPPDSDSVEFYLTFLACDPIWDERGPLIGEGAGSLRWVEDHPLIGFSVGSKTKPCYWIFSSSTLTLSAVVCVLSDSGGTDCPNTHFPLQGFDWILTTNSSTMRAISGSGCLFASLKEFLQVCSFLESIRNAQQRCVSCPLLMFLMHLCDGHVIKKTIRFHSNVK